MRSGRPSSDCTVVRNPQIASCNVIRHCSRDSVGESKQIAYQQNVRVRSQLFTLKTQVLPHKTGRLPPS
jgi:hypothetical protein